MHIFHVNLFFLDADMLDLVSNQGSLTIEHELLLALNDIIVCESV